MKIIFDSEEQRNKVDGIDILSICPSDIGLPDHCKSAPSDGYLDACLECWVKAGLEIEVKEKTNENHI